MRIRTFATSSSKQWLQRHTSDYYVKQSINNNVRSRSYYKLEEILIKHQQQLISLKGTWIDLGCSPGGWSLSAVNFMKKHNFSSNLIGVDLLPMEAIPGAHFIQGNFLDETVKDEVKNRIVTNNKDVTMVLSDMLQNTSGDHARDHFKSIELSRAALSFAYDMLPFNTGGFICKYLRGEDEKEFIDEAKDIFKEVKVVKPKASRPESAEAYILCLKKKS
jgi:23S rRNA (uridine2552-2'-O)-methyltransferase